MVFATDFDPIASGQRRQTPQGKSASNAVNISPVHQTNRLIAQAAQAQKAAKAAAQKAAAQAVPVNVDVAARRAQQPTGDRTALAPLPLPVKPTLPLKLKVLNHVQHGSTVVATLLISGALLLYGSSVYVDKSANRAMAHLNQLQSESQQLTTTNEAIKQTLAEQALQENSGLEPHGSGDILFLEPEPLRPDNELVEEAPDRLRPLGY